MATVQAPTSTGWRLFRACVFAVVATQLAALGHVLAGGTLPDMTVLITVTVFLGGSLSGLATRRRPGWQIFLALVASQLVFHLAFVATVQHTDAPADGMPGGLTTERMVVFHLLAAIAAAWLMAGGESMLFRLFAALHRVRLPAPRSLIVGVGPAWTAVISGDVCGRLLQTRLGSLLSRRGPPLPS